MSRTAGTLPGTAPARRPIRGRARQNGEVQSPSLRAAFAPSAGDARRRPQSPARRIRAGGERRARRRRAFRENGEPIRKNARDPTVPNLLVFDERSSRRQRRRRRRRAEPTTRSPGLRIPRKLGEDPPEAAGRCRTRACAGASPLARARRHAAAARGRRRPGTRRDAADARGACAHTRRAPFRSARRRTQRTLRTVVRARRRGVLGERTTTSRLAAFSVRFFVSESSTEGRGKQITGDVFGDVFGDTFSSVLVAFLRRVPQRVA